jgi:hypothetical protein
MKLAHALSALVVFLLVVCGVYFLYVALGTDAGWSLAYGMLSSDLNLLLTGVLAGLLMMLVFSMTTPRSRTLPEYISFDGHGGEVSISLKAVKDFVQRIAAEYAAIVNMQPTLTVRNGSIEVELDVRVTAGTHIPELCQMLQERVRESMTDTLGLSDIRTIKVNVREIGGHTPPQEPAKEPPRL